MTTDRSEYKKKKVKSLVKSFVLVTGIYRTETYVISKCDLFFASVSKTPLTVQCWLILSFTFDFIALRIKLQLPYQSMRRCW